MPNKTRKEYETIFASLPDEQRADIFALWTDIDEREKRIESLTREKKDADEIVKNSAAVASERDALKTQKIELESKLAALTGKESDEVELDAFAPIFAMLGKWFR